MTTHRFDLAPITGQGMITPCHYQGAEVLRSFAPIYDAARWLLDHGADPSDTVETWRGDMRCMAGIVGRVAEWTITETDKEGLRMVLWADVLAERSRLAGRKANGRFPSMASAVDGKIALESIHMALGQETPSMVPSHADLGAELPVAA